MKRRGIELPEADPETRRRAVELAARAPEPALAGNVRAGTAGWTDPMLLKSGFYPREASTPERRLGHYSRHFSLVEVDATYYALIAPATVERWARATPADFHFGVKAHPVLTGHPIDVARLPADLKHEFAEALPGGRIYPDRAPLALVQELETRFVASLDPLARAGKLKSVLCQFPPWFGATRGNARRIEQLAERWASLPLSVELRNSAWFEVARSERLFDLLARHGLSYVCVDEPDTRIGGVPPLARVTNPALAVVRFHGQNRTGWEQRGASVAQRFNYLYAPEELAAWVLAIRRLADEAEQVHVTFNNCVRDYAVINAKGLVALLTGPEPVAAGSGDIGRR